MLTLIVAVIAVSVEYNQTTLVKRKMLSSVKLKDEHNLSPGSSRVKGYLKDKTHPHLGQLLVKKVKNIIVKDRIRKWTRTANYSIGLIAIKAKLSITIYNRLDKNSPRT